MVASFKIYYQYIFFEFHIAGASRAAHELAGGLGIEPKLIASKATVLPLDDPPIYQAVARAQADTTYL